MIMEKEAGFYRIDHEIPVKVILRNISRLKSFLRYSLPIKKFQALDFDRVEYLGTEFLKKVQDKTSRKSFRNIRGDLIVKIGLKGMDTDTLICIIVEHKSRINSIKEFFLQVIDYNLALIEVGECPVLNVCLFHGPKPLNIPKDLKAFLGWTPEMREVLGDSGLNCGIEWLDLNRKLDEDIKDNAGVVTGLCFLLKHVWELTQDTMKSAVKLILKDRVNPEDDDIYKTSLSSYMLQATNIDRDTLQRIEREVIPNKEERFMLSTYDRAINEGLERGLEKGLEKGRLEGRQEGIQAGRQEGRLEGRQEGLKNVILNMLKDKMNVQSIMQYTGASKDQVLELQKQVGF